MQIRSFLVALAFAASSAAVHAGALDELNAFATQTKSARATFTQTVVGRNGKVTQRASGTFAFQRPGRFRFVYEKPYEQTIVGDGKKLWTWDKELNQVTIKPMTDALGATPAALLTGDGALERNFTLKEIGEADGLQWVEATPRQQEAGFEKVRIGFKAGQPLAMEVHDNFQQTTTLLFSGFERNARIDPSDFHFTPPKGADVVGE